MAKAKSKKAVAQPKQAAKVEVVQDAAKAQPVIAAQVAPAVQAAPAVQTTAKVEPVAVNAAATDSSPAPTRGILDGANIVITAAKPEAVAASLPSHEDIARRAYQVYQARGGRPGNAWEDWAQAERELMAQQQSPRASA